MSVAGLLLAAGAGRRMGRPKALVHDPDGTSWLHRSLGVLRDAGCDPIIVVLGARADQARELLGPGAPGGVRVVVADDWDSGMSASLVAGLRSLEADRGASAAVVTLVDLPDVSAEVARRVVAGAERSALARATYDGRPGHPVLLGRDHWAGVIASAGGDHGARDYLGSHVVVAVECADLATGRDQDTPPPD